VRFLLSSIFPRQADPPDAGWNKNAQKSELHIPTQIQANKSDQNLVLNKKGGGIGFWNM